MTGALIGRHAELPQVVEALKQSRSGATRTVVIRGEPGIGKSRFLNELLDQARLLGHVTRLGRLDDLDRLIPFAAIRAALWSALDDERDPSLHGSVQAVCDALAPAGGTVSLAQFAGELETLLRAWAAREPLVLAVDDLHAADVDTLRVLSLLIRELRNERITFVFATRAHPPDVSVELAATIDRLRNDDSAVVVELGPLDVDDVRALTRLEVDAVPDERLVDLLWQSTKGNPFYVLEGVRSLQAADELAVDGGRCRLVSTSTLAAIRAPSAIVYRLFDLGPAARAVARAVTAFRRFSLDDLGLLYALTGLDASEADAAFDTLVTANVLVRDGDGYEFAHPIVRHTLYDDLGPAERRRMHATIADHLLAAREAGREVAPSDLATHVAASATPGDDRAIEAILAAAESMATSAPASAASWYERALDLLSTDDTRRGELLAARARCLFLASQLERATTAAAAALDLLPEGRLRARTAALHVTMLTAMGRFEEALERSDRILEQSTQPLPGLLAERGALLTLLDRFDDAVDETNRALELAGDDDGARALAYRALATVAQTCGDIDGFRAMFDSQMAIAEHLGPAARLSALTTHAMHLTMCGFITESFDTIAEAERVRDTLGGDALRDPLDVAYILSGWQAGEWDAVLDRARWLSVAGEPEQMWVGLAHCAEAHIHVARGNVAAARAVAEKMAVLRFASSSMMWARAQYHQLAGEHGVAERLLLDAWERDRAAGRLSPAHTLLGALVELSLARGDRASARRWVDTLDEVRVETPSPVMLTVADRCVAAVRDDVEAGRRALAVADDHGMTLEATHACLVLGELGDDAPAHLIRAYESYKAMGAESLRRRTAHAMKAAGVATPRARRRKSGELTDTEVQLCKLVSDGMTNREIAGVLIISPKTVEVYLSRLFAKVGVKSRVELAVAVSDGRVPLEPST